MVQHIELSFAPCDRTMLDVHSLCSSWACYRSSKKFYQNVAASSPKPQHCCQPFGPTLMWQVSWWRALEYQYVQGPPVILWRHWSWTPMDWRHCWGPGGCSAQGVWKQSPQKLKAFRCTSSWLLPDTKVFWGYDFWGIFPIQMPRINTAV